MNEFDKVVMLIEKGFTKDEVEALLGASAIQQSAPAQEPDPAPAPDPEPAAPEPPAAPAGVPDPEPPAAPAMPVELNSALDSIRSSLDELRQAVQANNIRTMSTPTNKAEDMNEILANYINPPGLASK